MSDQPDSDYTPPIPFGETPDDSQSDSQIDRQENEPSGADSSPAPRRRTTRQTYPLAMAAPALTLIGVGAVLLLNTFDLVSFAPLIVLALIGVGCLLRFMLNGRRERGIAFIGLLVLLWLGCGVLFIAGPIGAGQAWPLLVVAVGFALWITFALERTHDRGALLPGLIAIWAGGIALIFTFQLVAVEPLRGLATLWPFLLVLFAIALLPRVFRIQE